VGRDDARDAFPSVAPTVALYSRMIREGSPVSPLFFKPGYLVTWRGAGLLSFAIALARTGSPPIVLARDHAGRWVAGATLLGAVVYELRR
jgi:predicted metal-binding membrane protein